MWQLKYLSISLPCVLMYISLEETLDTYGEIYNLQPVFICKLRIVLTGSNIEWEKKNNNRNV